MTTKSMKQVAVVALAEASQEQVPGGVEQTGSTTPIQSQKHLYFSVEVFDPKNDGKSIGFRIVDIYHPGTREWLNKHLWWAMHNGHIIETKTASDEEISQHIEDQTKRLAAKYGKAA